MIWATEFAHRTQFLFRTLIKLPLKMVKLNLIWGRKTREKISTLPKNRVVMIPSLIRNAKECGISHAIWLENYEFLDYICHMTLWTEILG